MINLTQEQKEALRNIIEGEAYANFNDIEVAKDNIKELAKSVKESMGVETKDFNKMLKLFAQAKYDEEKTKNEYFNKLYEEVLG